MKSKINIKPNKNKKNNFVIYSKVYTNHMLLG